MSTRPIARIDAAAVANNLAVWAWAIDDHYWGGGYMAIPRADTARALLAGMTAVLELASVDGDWKVPAPSRIQVLSRPLKDFAPYVAGSREPDGLDYRQQIRRIQELKLRLGVSVELRRRVGLSGELEHIRQAAADDQPENCGPYGAWMMGGRIEKGPRIVFTDASVDPIQQVGGWAVYRGGKHIESGVEEGHTINFLETVAIDEALTQPGDLIVRSDSQVACRVIADGVPRRAASSWRREPMRQVLESIRSKLDDSRRVLWCKGHIGVYGNGVADQAARAAYANLSAA